jgi:hypothetical protein
MRLRQAAIVILALTMTSPAPASSARDLAGWWLAIDDVFPSSWANSEPQEELLVVTPAGTIENRAMWFRRVSASECATDKLCSDAPLIASGSLNVTGDKIEISARAPVSTDSVHRSFVAAALTARPDWQVTLSHNNHLLALRSGGVTRMLVRIDPDRLRRLRAGLMVASLSPDKHWRCFLTNATAGESAYESLRKSKHAAPKFLPDYLRIASLRESLAAMGARPTADDPDPVRRTLASTPVETLMVESFKDVGAPAAATDARRYRAQGAFIDQRARGASPQEANIVATALNGGVPVTVVASAPEYSALSRVMARDADTRQLFCVN